MRSAPERRELLRTVYEEARRCVRCPLHQTRTNVVFGAGNADADLMFIGEAPGANEDRMGLPFVGQAGKLLDKMLAEIGMERQDVFVANTLKCLRYDAPVQLADGSWERIGRLVRSRYSGGVMSVDSDGHLVPRRVIGWHATPLAGRRVFRMGYKSAKNVGARGRVAIELTGDHPVLTERGYVPVEELQPGDRIATGQGIGARARDVVRATVLGDGCLQGASSHLSFHSQHQIEYAQFKADLLAELRPDVHERVVAAVAGGERMYRVVHVRTRADRGLQRLGLPAKASRRRLFFDVRTTERLSELIAPYAPPSMRYKLPSKVAERIPFDTDFLDPGEKTVVYDDVEVEDVTDHERHDTSFFCIDVEDTHNFVTAGGVVHNCRPPDNRDPHPNEIEACQDYLRRQVDLIEPTVICTLGNFSTKLLRADSTGISRLHGREEVRIIGPRAVRLYPLYHPAAALYTPSMLEALRADFHRIPELLALGPPAQPQALEEPVPELDQLVAEAQGRPEAAEPEPAAQLGLF